MSFRNLILVAIMAWGGWHYWTHRSENHAPGVLAGDEPIQHMVHQESLSMHGYTITPRARFDIKARVLSREDYRAGREADLSPVDFALGWGPMSDTAVLNKIKISQSGRFYFWYTEDPPIPLGEISTHSSNMHMIPANDEVRAKLDRVRQGQIVEISARLVDVDAQDGWHWRTSLTRTDTGDGACEILLVEDVTTQPG